MDRGTRTWSTASVPPAEQFVFWRDVVCEAFIPLSPLRHEAGPFAGRIAAHQQGPMTVTQVDAQAVTARRTTELVRRRAGDVVFLNLQTRSAGVSTQGGRSASQAPGDLTLIDSTQPFELVFGDAWSQICVAIPIEIVEAKVTAWSAVTAVCMPNSAGLTTLIGNEMRCLSRAEFQLDREAARGVASQLADLVALAIGRAPSRPPLSDRALLLQAALDALERRLDDPGLAPGQVADDLNISLRYLHSLFADRGVTFKQSLLRQRLELCRRALADPGRSHLTIGEISTRHGFADRTYFARAYRARYGLTPSEDRRRRTANMS